MSFNLIDFEEPPVITIPLSMRAMTNAGPAEALRPRISPRRMTADVFSAKRFSMSHSGYRIRFFV